MRARRASLLGAVLSLTLAGASCGPAAINTPAPTWSSTTVELGQGQVHLGVRLRWVAERDGAGAVIRTPDRGEALVRIFACGRPLPDLLEHLRQRLRWRLVANEFGKQGEVVSFRYWRGKASAGVQVMAALALHGPLVISVTSSNLEMADLIGIAERVRLTLPVAPLAGCLPLCDLEESPCTPAAEDET